MHIALLIVEVSTALFHSVGHRTKQTALIRFTKPNQTMFFLVTFTPYYFSMQVELLTFFGFIGKLCGKPDSVFLLSALLPPQQKRVPLKSMAWTNTCGIWWFKSAPNLAFHRMSFSIVFIGKQPSRSWYCSMLKKWTKLMFKIKLPPTSPMDRFTKYFQLESEVQLLGHSLLQRHWLPIILHWRYCIDHCFSNFECWVLP
ncbi:uncharacterized protein LOC104444709 isoform X2 [Eucalyptus grandis]|uniref:uncharacterized protein LOC104444709 isoform X2 n=1 Tax=Eucalyptus grandis TaxID=71139 RepID=UPI00192EC6F3|nr:uncharacterized protein LOC104444709 isoform X2 [Eucalyptus grandis]